MCMWLGATISHLEVRNGLMGVVATGPWSAGIV